MHGRMVAVSSHYPFYLKALLDMKRRLCYRIGGAVVYPSVIANKC
jgi:hypothetical protein